MKKSFSWKVSLANDLALIKATDNVMFESHRSQHFLPGADYCGEPHQARALACPDSGRPTAVRLHQPANRLRFKSYIYLHGDSPWVQSYVVTKTSHN